MPQVRCIHPLPSHPESVSRARDLVRLTLTAHGHESTLDAALLIMSELTTNAIMHATDSATIEILCELDSGILTLGVIDHDNRQPIILDVTPDDEHGRGLILINSISDEWGCHPHGPRKLVFARLKLEDSPVPAELTSPYVAV